MYLNVKHVEVQLFTLLKFYVFKLKQFTVITKASPSGRAVESVGLRPLACWYCGFEYHRGHGCLSVMSVVCCQVEVSATGWSLLQRNPTECSVSECDPKTSRIRRP